MPQMEAISILTAAAYYLVKIFLLRRDYCNIITVESRTDLRR